MIKFRHLAFLFLTSLFLTVACQTPQNASEAIGQGYAELTAAAHDVAQARASGLISDMQATKLKADLQKAKDALDVATDAYAAGDTTSAQGRAMQAHAILQVIIAALQEAQK